MGTCWAEQQGDCSGALSSEHVITRGLFPQKMVPASGMPRLKGATGLVSIDTMTVKLCTHHNGVLSELDDAAIDFVCALRERNRLIMERFRARFERNQTEFSAASLAVNGLLLQRWCLKTTINCWRAGHQGFANWRPPRSMVAAVFGAELSGGAGLGLLVEQDDQDDEGGVPASIGINELRRVDRSVSGSLVRVGGVTLVSTWDQPIAATPFESTHGAMRLAEFHAAEIGAGILNVVLQFDWSGRPIPVVERSITRAHHHSIRR